MIKFYVFISQILGCSKKPTKCPAGAPGPKGPPGEPGMNGVPGVDAPSYSFAADSLQSNTIPKGECLLCPPGRPGPVGQRGVIGKKRMLT